MTSPAYPRRRTPAWPAAWLGIFALYLQLAAAAACLSGALRADVPAADASIFPICHGHASNDGAPGAPRTIPCPICAFHAQAATALPPPAGLAAFARLLVAAPAARPRTAAPGEGRILIAAAPRGPPAA